MIRPHPTYIPPKAWWQETLEAIAGVALLGLAGCDAPPPPGSDVGETSGDASPTLKEAAPDIVNDTPVAPNPSTDSAGDGFAVDAVEKKPIEWVSAGRDHSCAFSKSQVYCWGHYASGQLGIASDQESVTPQAVKKISATQVSGGAQGSWGLEAILPVPYQL
jgi:hypothetical protein